MDIIGTQLCITLGAWRLHFNFAIEETEECVAQMPPKMPHRLYVKQSEERGAHR